MQSCKERIDVNDFDDNNKYSFLKKITLEDFGQGEWSVYRKMDGNFSEENTPFFNFQEMENTLKTARPFHDPVCRLFPQCTLG